MFEEIDKLMKLIVIGDSNTGKTQLLAALSKSKKSDVYLPTIGVDFFYDYFETSSGKVVKLQCWDTAGQERFLSITRSYYYDKNIALLCFSLDDKQTLDHLHGWYDTLKMRNDSIKIILVATKCDKSKRDVSIADISQFMTVHNDVVAYFITSSEKDHNITELREFIYGMCATEDEIKGINVKNVNLNQRITKKKKSSPFCTIL